MNKLTKISAAILFAFFVSACDTATDKAQASSVTQIDTEEQGIADFNKMVEWNQAQENVLANVQQDLQEKISSGDQAQIEEAVKTFSAKINGVLESLDKLALKHSAVIAVKEKTKHTLILSNELILETVKVMANPTQEAQKMVQERGQTLLQTGQELQQLQQQLQQRFAPEAK